MYLTYPYFPVDDLYEPVHARNGRYPNRLDVQRHHLEETRMSHLSSEHELVAEMVIDQHVQDALRAARLREARNTHPQEASVSRLRSAIGNLLIGFGEHIKPAPRTPQRRVIIPRERHVA